MKNNTSCELKNEEEAVSPVIATILMVAITVVLAGVLYVWASELASNQTDFGTFNNYLAEDIRPTTSSAVNDPLLRMRFSNGPDDLSWAFLEVKLSGEDGTMSVCDIGSVDALGEEINVFTLITDANAHDLSTQADTNGELPDGSEANWATRLPNDAGFFAAAYAADPSTGLATGESYFLAYDFDQYGAGTGPGGVAAGGDYEYRIYSVDPVSGDANDGHSFNVAATVTSAGQYLYFASQYAGDYVSQVPGNEVLVTGNMYWDIDGDGVDDTPAFGIKAVNIATGYIAPIAMTGAAPSQAIGAVGDLMYFYDNGDGTQSLMGAGATAQGAGAYWTGSVLIQKNNRMVGSDNALIFMSSEGMEMVVMTGDGPAAMPTNTNVQGYALGFTNDLAWLVVGESTDVHVGGSNFGGFTLVALDGSGNAMVANTAGYAVFGTYGTVLNSPTGNTYLYYNAINLATGSVDVMAYGISGTDANGDYVDDGSAVAQGFESRSTITMDPSKTNFGAYSGVIGVYREGTNENNQDVFQLIIMNPDLGINLAFWSDQIGLLSNLAAVLGLSPEAANPNFNAGFYTQYVHDLGLGSGKILTTNVDDYGNMDPGLIDLMAMLESMNSGDAAGEATTDAKCIIFQESGTDDGYWQGTEVITIFENGYDICGVQTTSSCDLEVMVYYQGKLLAGSGSVNII